MIKYYKRVEYIDSNTKVVNKINIKEKERYVKLDL